MPGGRLPEKENKRCQISDLKSGHGHLRNLVAVACKRVFETVFN